MAASHQRPCMGLRTSSIGRVLGRALKEARTSEKLLLPRRRSARIWPGPARRPLATGRQSPTARPRAACITMTGSALHLCECATRAVRWTRCQHSSRCRAGRPCGRGARAPSSVLWGLVGGSELTLRTGTVVSPSLAHVSRVWKKAIEYFPAKRQVQRKNRQLKIIFFCRF